MGLRILRAKFVLEGFISGWVRDFLTGTVGSKFSL